MANAWPILIMAFMAGASVALAIVSFALRKPWTALGALGYAVFAGTVAVVLVGGRL
jgi:hypothetical protein